MVIRDKVANDGDPHLSNKRKSQFIYFFQTIEFPTTLLAEHHSPFLAITLYRFSQRLSDHIHLLGRGPATKCFGAAGGFLQEVL